MAEAVVDHLEPVEVEEQHRHVVAPFAGPGPLEPVGEQHPVGQPGEGVVQGLVGQRLLGLPLPFDQRAPLEGQADEIAEADE